MRVFSRDNIQVLTEILGGGIIEESIRDPYKIIALINKGFPANTWKSLSRWGKFSPGEIAEYLNISEDSLRRKRKLSKSASDEILQIARILAKGYAVFDSQQGIINWLHDEVFVYGEPPKKLLGTSVGRELISNTLTQIVYGLYS
jgi:putative toxin-antitoxin system antitoxin component (TIGR02293 family)